MKYSDLNIKLNIETKDIEFNGKNIKIKQYLSAESKLDIINAALDNSEINGVYNDFMVNIFANVYIVFYYTDLEFTLGEKEDVSKIYDELASSGLLKMILNSIPKSEIDCIAENIVNFEQQRLKNNLSIVSVLKGFMNFDVEDIEKVTNLLETFDQDKYKQVVDLAKYSGMR